MNWAATQPSSAALGAAIYARRKTVVEPVFGQIKQARGFRRFLLRGLKKVQGAWAMVCLTHNILKLHRLLLWIERGKEIPKTLHINVVDLCEKLFYGQGSDFGRDENRALLFSHFGPGQLRCFKPQFPDGLLEAVIHVNTLRNARDTKRRKCETGQSLLS